MPGQIPKPGPLRKPAGPPANISIEPSGVPEADLHASANRMASYAKLTIDWQTGERSHLDNFANFVFGAMASEGIREATPEKMASAVASKYGLRFPVAVTQQIARRAARQKQFERMPKGVFKIVDDALQAGLSHARMEQELQREQNKLVSIFQGWLDENNLSYPGTQDEILPMLLEYVETYFGTLLIGWAGSSYDRSLPSAQPDDNTRLTAAFIAHLDEGEPEAFKYLLNIVKGSMLSASLFSQGSDSPPGHFTSTTLVLDTRIVLRLLGCEGELSQNATSEYLEAAQRMGARLGCFDFTLSEIRKIMWSAETSARQGKLWQWTPGSTGAHFLDKGLDATDITLAIDGLEDDLVARGITVIANPSYDDRRTIVDEGAIEDLFRTLASNYKEDALRHDALALSAIIRMREGRAKPRLEDCRAVFVTTNSFVVRASRRVQDLRSEPWFVSIFDTDLASLIWVKTPLKAPDLPRGALIATCLSVLNPSEATWSRYVRELEGRHDRKEISDADLMIVRQALEARRLELSLSEMEDDSSVGARVSLSITEAREEVRREVLEPEQRKTLELQRLMEREVESRKSAEIAVENLRSEWDLEREARLGVERQLRALQEEANARYRRKIQNAEKWAERIANLCGGLVIAFFVAASIVGVWANVPDAIGVWLPYIAAALALGGGVSFFATPVKRKVKAYLRGKLLARIYVPQKEGQE